MHATQSGKTGAAGRTRKAMPRQVFVGMCCAYLFLGASSIVAGVLVYAMPAYLGINHTKFADNWLSLIAFVLVGFGLARIGLASRNLLRLKKQPRTIERPSLNV